MKKVILLFCLILSSTIYISAQIEADEVLFSKAIILSDEKIHKLEIKSDGVYLDSNIKNKSNNFFTTVTFLSETDEYWKYENSGTWLLVGTDTATGMCGLPTYAMIFVDSYGNVRVSKESPSVCIGDFPFSINFKLDSKVGQTIDDSIPIWIISNSLEFNGKTFLWKEIKVSKRTRKK